MKYRLRILRRRRGAEEKEAYWQDFTYETDSEAETVASALTELCARDELVDAGGEPARRIEWERSCLQKKCGACAMVINGRPGLACDSRLAEMGPAIRVEPLRKFPVICDLIVDRSILYENLKTLRIWLKDSARLPDPYQDLAYQGSECVQCGCCLEVCPNFYPGGKFCGMSTVPLTTRLLTETEPADMKELARLYAKHTFAGCGKSLACMDVCPRKIDTEKLLVNNNALAIWKRRKKG